MGHKEVGPLKSIRLSIDGHPVSVPVGSTVLTVIQEEQAGTGPDPLSRSYPETLRGLPVVHR